MVFLPEKHIYVNLTYKEEGVPVSWVAINVYKKLPFFHPFDPHAWGPKWDWTIETTGRWRRFDMLRQYIKHNGNCTFDLFPILSIYQVMEVPNSHYALQGLQNSPLNEHLNPIIDFVRFVHQILQNRRQWSWTSEHVKLSWNNFVLTSLFLLGLITET